MATEQFDAVLAEMRAGSEADAGLFDWEVAIYANRLAAAHAAEKEAAERDARRLQEVLNLVPARELNDWLGADMDCFVRAPTLDEFRAAIDAAIAATEAAHES